MSLPAAPRQALSGDGRFRESRSIFSEIPGDKTREVRSSPGEMASQSCLHDHRKIPFGRSSAISDFPIGVRIETRYGPICGRGTPNRLEFCGHGQWRDHRRFRKQRAAGLSRLELRRLCTASFLPQQCRRDIYRSSSAGRAFQPAGRPQHDSSRLQQRRLHGYPGVARRLGISHAKIIVAK